MEKHSSLFIGVSDEEKKFNNTVQSLSNGECFFCIRFCFFHPHLHSGNDDQQLFASSLKPWHNKLDRLSLEIILSLVETSR
jgi:hypothetical protein